MKGIILAGGFGTRLFPLTKVLSKHLLPIYDKPMIYYPLSVLMQSGIKDILIICKQEDINLYQKLLNDGNSLGIRISYELQKEPNGLPEAFIIGEKFIKQENIALILGDNLFYGGSFRPQIEKAKRNLHKKNTTIFCTRVADPQNYGVVKIVNKKVNKIIEKPKKHISSNAITGLYFLTNDVVKISKNLKKSKRGEYEIVDILNIYKKKRRLKYSLLEDGFTWLDAGSHESYLEACNFVETIEKRKGLKISCIEEVALKMNYINKNNLKKIIKKYPNNEYKIYLKKILNEKL